MLMNNQIFTWFMVGTVFVVSVNMYLVYHLPLPFAYGSANSSKSNNKSELDSFTNCSNGEIFYVKKNDCHSSSLKTRPGLKMISKLYEYLPAIKSYYKSQTSKLFSIIHKLKMDADKLFVTKKPWDLAQKWISSQSLISGNATGLGDILLALKSWPIKSADVGYKGTQLKISFILKNNQQAVFKPKRYSRDKVIEGSVYDGADRHNGEVAAFHLSRLLNLTMVPVTVGRKVSLRRNILPVASRRLSNTFFSRGKRACTYGSCYYCRRDRPVCDEAKSLEGVVILWIQSPLAHYRHPWARTYDKNKMARWELNANFCRTFSPSLFSSENLGRLLNLIDVAIFDFLIQNGDRHHFTIFSGDLNSSIVMIDNGKSFGNPFVDHLDILAPLLQCCRIRKVTYDRLVMLSGGGLSKSLRQLLAVDSLSPVVTDAHLEALDRRLVFVLAAVALCKDQNNGKTILS